MSARQLPWDCLVKMRMKAGYKHHLQCFCVFLFTNYIVSIVICLSAIENFFYTKWVNTVGQWVVLLPFRKTVLS